MKHFILSFLITPFLVVSVNGQNKKNCGIVKYQHITKLREATFNQPATLAFNGYQSTYTYGKGKKPLVKTVNGKQDIVVQDAKGNIFYKDFSRNELKIREIVWMQPYLTQEPGIPQIQWKMGSEQKKIGSFKCQKATTRFRGRNYTAWFTPEIPIPNGPWKLQGLPGLILEAYDNQREIQFLFTSVAIPCDQLPEITAPKKGLKASFEDYKNADMLEFNKMKRKMMAKQSRGSNTNMKRVKPNLLEKEYEN